jgi:ribosome-associated toxin RatA of RatAB toxin-antitoxin module
LTESQVISERRKKMAQAEYKEVLPVVKDKLLATIMKYEDYPEFVEGCESVQVERRLDGVVRVSYHVSQMSQDITYTLDHVENVESGTIEWHLVDSNFFKKNNGKWEIKPAGTGKSEVLYSLDVEFKIPVPGFILNRLVKGSLPGMVKSFGKQANGR